MLEPRDETRSPSAGGQPGGTTPWVPPQVPEVGTVPATVAWDVAEALGSQSPVLAAFEAEPERAAKLAALRVHAPVARTGKPFLREPWCRPTIHRRAIYLQLDEGGVLAIKGTEPHADDLAEEVAHLEAARAPFFSSMLNEFATSEQKVPMGMSMNEARDEAEITLAFQRAYFERFGRLAQVPFPLLVYRWDEHAERRLLEAVMPSLCVASQRSTRAMVRDGLGALVYYYPSLPLRASQEAPHAIALLSAIAGLRLPAGTGIHERAGVSFDVRKAVLRRRGEPWEVVRSWISLVADMLVVGWFPLHTYFMGHCLQGQNLCIDGGVVDTDSLKPMSEVEGDLFYELFIQTVGELTKGSTVYLTGTFVGRYTDQMLGNTIWQLLYDDLRERVREQPPADPRLQAIVEAPHVERIDTILTHLLRGATPDNAPRIT